MALSAEDLEVVATARRDGAAVVRNLLTPSELAAARRDFDAAHLANGKGRFDDEENVATRTGMLGDHLGLLPGLAQLYAHPRIVGIVGAIMGEDCPFLHEMKTNRYTAGHQGVTPHSDNGPDWSMPWEKIATMIFLDDIGEESGALEYLPTTHLQHFLSDDGVAPSSSPPPQPRGPEVNAAHAEGLYQAISLPAGSVVFRVPAVWHAVRPIHRLRRYVTARYYISSARPIAEEGMATIDSVVERRRTDEGASMLRKLPAELQRLCDPDIVHVVPLDGDAAAAAAKL